MSARKYATSGELKDYLKLATAPPNADDLLEGASEEIDEILLASYYPTNDDGIPTDSAVAEALKRATLAQAKHRYEYGDDVAISTSGGSMSLGPLSIGATPAASAAVDSGVPQFSRRAFRILRNAGLLTTQVGVS